MLQYLVIRRIQMKNSMVVVNGMDGNGQNISKLFLDNFMC